MSTRLDYAWFNMSSVGYVSYSRALIDSQVLRAKPGALAMPTFVTVIITVISIVTDL